MNRPIDDTIESKFKGVPFFVSTETQETGRKVVVHEYPGASVRFVEDLGKLPSIFRISAYVSGDDWLKKAKRLSTALEESTEGVLEMSVFGIRKVKARTYTRTISQKTVGRVDFIITFLVSTPNPSPAIASASVETVAVLAVEVLKALQDFVARVFTVPELAAESKVATYDGEQLSVTIAERIKQIGQDVDNITTVADRIRTNINELVRDPVAYASEMFNDGLLGAVFDNIEVSRETLNALKELVRVGYNLAVDFESIEDDLLSNAEQSFIIPIFATDTRYRLSNNRNRITVTNSVRTGLLATYLNQAARNEYATDDEINDTIADIEDAYENIVLVDDVDPLIALGLDRCRVDALKVLEDKLQTTPKVVDFDLKTSTVDAELAYRLYAEDMVTSADLETTAEVLTDLNGVLPTRFKDDVKVLKV